MPKSYPTTRMCSGEILSRFEPTCRDSDVFTATVAKCGQTWLCALLHHLRTKGRDPGYGGEGLMQKVPWLELPIDPVTFEPLDVDERLAELESLESPRVFKMHVVWQELPRPPGSRAKVITITRDPRDVPWSLYQHMLALKKTRVTEPPESFESFFEVWFERDFYGRWLASFWPHRDDEDVLWLRYEDMKADTVGEARRIVAHLGWQCTDDELRQAVENASLRKMKADEESGTLEFKKAFDKPFVRQGEIGENRKHLTPDMERRIVHRFRDNFTQQCCDFLFRQFGDVPPT